VHQHDGRPVGRTSVRDVDRDAVAKLYVTMLDTV
jgi:hypothetical protein